MTITKEYISPHGKGFRYYKVFVFICLFVEFIKTSLELSDQFQLHDEDESVHDYVFGS